MRIVAVLLVLLLSAASVSAQTLNVKTGSFQTTTDVATTTVAVSGVGFTPELILFSLTGVTSAGTVTNLDSHLGFGAAASTSSRWAVGSAAADTPTTSDTAQCHREDALICTVGPAGSLTGLMDLSSMDVDGFTLIIDDAFPADYLVNYIAFQGDLDVSLGRFTAAGTGGGGCVDGVGTGCQEVSIASFTPTAVLFATTRDANDPPQAAAAAGRVMVGAMTGASAEGVTFFTAADGQPDSDTASYSFDAEAIAAGTAAAVTDRAEFSAFIDSGSGGGFRINWLERGTAARIYYVAIKGVSATVGHFLTQTDTTTAITEGSFGFQPKGVVVLSHGTTKSTQDTMQVNAQMSLGFGAATPAVTVATMFEEDGLGLMQIDLSQNATANAIYQNIDTSDAVIGAMSVQSWDSDGLTFIMSDADPAQAFGWYFALGGAAVAATNAPKCLLLGACE